MLFSELYKISGVGGGVQAHPQKFWFVENPGKIYENLGKVPENLGKNGAQLCLTSNWWRPTLGGEKQRKAFLEVTPKKICSSWSLWKKICRQMPHNNFSGKFREIRAKILRTPKILFAPSQGHRNGGALRGTASLPFERGGGNGGTGALTYQYHK